LLDELYLEYLETVIIGNPKLIEGIFDGSISSPHLINASVPSGGYEEADFKIVFVGKESNGWFNTDERIAAGIAGPPLASASYLTALKDLYLNFNLGAEYNTSIYQFIRMVRDGTSTEKIKAGYLLTNLLRIDSMGKPSPGVEEDVTIKSNYILSSEIEILNPGAVVFLSGPSYDYLIEKTYPGSKFTEVPGFATSEFSQIRHEKLPEKTVRVYHPDYHKYKGPEYRHDLAKAICNILR